jgi:hypothetical protein
VTGCAGDNWVLNITSIYPKEKGLVNIPAQLKGIFKLIRLMSYDALV